MIAWLVHASFLYGLKDLYFGSEKDAIPLTDVRPVSNINVDKSVSDDSSYDSILEYLVTDDYDDSPEIRERPNHWDYGCALNVKFLWLAFGRFVLMKISSLSGSLNVNQTCSRVKIHLSLFDSDSRIHSGYNSLFIWLARPAWRLVTLTLGVCAPLDFNLEVKTLFESRLTIAQKWNHLARAACQNFSNFCQKFGRFWFLLFRWVYNIIYTIAPTQIKQIDSQSKYYRTRNRFQKLVLFGLNPIRYIIAIWFMNYLILEATVMLVT